jgi:hypothetical protein
MAIVFHQAFMGWALWEGKGAVQFWDFKDGHHNGSDEDLNLTPKKKEKKTNKPIITVSNI